MHTWGALRGAGTGNEKGNFHNDCDGDDDKDENEYKEGGDDDELNWIEFIVLKRMYKGTLMVAHLYLFKEQLKMTTKLYHPYPFPER